jgi:hypothetical protein
MRLNGHSKCCSYSYIGLLRLEAKRQAAQGTHSTNVVSMQGQTNTALYVEGTLALEALEKILNTGNALVECTDMWI